MGQKAGLQAAVGGIVEAALVGVDPIAIGEIVQIADRLVAGRRAQELDLAVAEAVADQVAMEGLEAWRGEAAGLAAPTPAPLVQRFQLLEHGKRLVGGARRAQGQRTNRRI